MKKLKWILLFIMVLLAVLFLFATCRKTKALENGFRNYTVNISERDLDNYNLVAIYDLGSSNVSGSSDIFIIENTSTFYIGVNDSNSMAVVMSGTVESITLNSRLIEIDLVYDIDGLYIIVYEIKYTTQGNQTQEPVIDGISRTMKTRFQLSTVINNTWNNGDLSVILMTNNINYQANFLMNFAYISYADTPQDISSWVGKQLSNYLTYNNLIHAGYLAGNENGYLDGFDDGEERGYSDGYDAGEQAGYNNGYYTGRTEGLAEGEDIGYKVGYTDGQAGNTAITPVFNTLSGVFSVVGSVLAIELVPHIPLGIFILVPLFFAAVGLILWIWRRN